MKGAQILAESLIKMGTKYVYGIIGTSILYFVDALYQVRDKVRYISCRHEQVAASMADAEGRLTQKPGVVLTHSGPGTLNTLISLANAYKDCSPLILISGAVKRRLRGKDGMLEIDHLKIFSPVCKEVFRVEEASSIPQILSSAYKKAISYSKGPVLIEVPEDVWTETADVNLENLNFEPEPPPLPDEKDIQEIIEAIENSSLPLILAGGGVAYSNSSELLLKIVEKLKIPVITTGNGRGTISEEHPLCLGRVGFGGGNLIADTAYKNADLIIGLGCGISDMTTYEFTVNTAADIILVNFDPDIEKKGIYVTKNIYCDVKNFLEKMLYLISDKNFPERENWNNILNPVKKQWNQLLIQSASSNKTPVSPARVCAALSKMIPPETIITVGAGMHLLYPMAFIPCRRPLTFLSAVNFGAMGFGFAAGLSAKLNFPEKTVISILGDGDFLMTCQDLETAVRENIPLKIIIINDNSYRVLTTRQKLQLQGRIYGSIHKNPDFVKFAESFGAKGIRIEKPEEIEKKLKEMLESETVTLLEVVADPEDFPPINIEATLKMN